MSKITIDPRALAIYVKLRDGKVARTKEFAKEVFADLNSEGKLIGVEILRPGTLAIRRIARRFHNATLEKIAPDLEKLFDKLVASR